MTREEVLAMKPGNGNENELDALVAEKVFGAKVMLYTPQGRYYIIDKTYLPWGEIPPYSTDISAAWEVVGEMAKRKCYDGTPFFIQLEIRGNKCRATFMHPFIGSPAHDDRMEYVLVFSDTMPEAICKASLLAVLGL